MVVVKQCNCLALKLYCTRKPYSSLAASLYLHRSSGETHQTADYFVIKQSHSLAMHVFRAMKDQVQKPVKLIIMSTYLHYIAVKTYFPSFHCVASSLIMCVFSSYYTA